MFNKKVKTIINVDGMSCAHCAKKVQQSIKNIENVKEVKVDLDKKKVIIISTKQLDINNVKKVIEDLDYKFLGVDE